MNGFLLIGSGGQGLTGGRLPDVFRCFGISAEPFDVSGRLTTCLWGGLCGDVRRVTNASGSVLIAHGYFTEVPGFSGTADQRAVADFLLAKLEQGAALEEVGEFVSKLNGSFSILYWDSLRTRIWCITDRVASRPLWLAPFGEDWALSSSPLALALASGLMRLDCGSLVSRLLYGGLVEPQKSLFDQIESVSPGCVVEVKPHRLKRCCVWYRFQHEADQSRSTGDWLDVVSQRLVRAAERIGRTHPSPTLFFSGGVDSRLVAAALVAAGSRPKAITLGDGINPEVKIAAAAAKALRLEHQVVLRDEHWYLRRLERSVFDAGGSFLWTHAHFSQVVLADLNISATATFLLGDFGEAFSKLFCSTDGDQAIPRNCGDFLEQFDNRPMHLTLVTQRLVASLPLNTPPVGAICRPQESTG
ncbi:MAG: hypothetical protein EXS30_03935 [Pedosphaera sp.]|nr:hypothetical protein [Pedosphaera sp.]